MAKLRDLQAASDLGWVNQYVADFGIVTITDMDDAASDAFIRHCERRKGHSSAVFDQFEEFLQRHSEEAALDGREPTPVSFRDWAANERAPQSAEVV